MPESLFPCRGFAPVSFFLRNNTAQLPSVWIVMKKKGKDFLASVAVPLFFSFFLESFATDNAHDSRYIDRFVLPTSPLIWALRLGGHTINQPLREQFVDDSSWKSGNQWPS